MDGTEEPFDIKGLSDLKRFEITQDFVRKIVQKREQNEVISAHYKRYLNAEREKVAKLKIERKMEALSECNSLWFLDKYDKQRVKDYRNTNLCRDKFCANCKVVKSAERKARFYPLIDAEKNKDRHMYHLVLTAPKVPAAELNERIKLMFKKFGAYLMRYIACKLKIKGVTSEFFGKWGYVGAIRSLEVTYKTGSNQYHPHLHVMLVFNQAILGPKAIKNSFSKDKYGKRKERLFSLEEVLIQKIWYLLLNDITVNQTNLDELKEGYSCTIDEFGEEDYNELFKYMTKTNDGAITYNNFRTLYESLMGVRQIQGYGCFFGIDDEEPLDDVVDELYQKVQDYLQKEEAPIHSCESVEELSKDTEYTLISRKRIYSYYKREMQNIQDVSDSTND